MNVHDKPLHRRNREVWFSPVGDFALIELWVGIAILAGIPGTRQRGNRLGRLWNNLGKPDGGT